MKNFILATAGHVDHGKTALIKALTGTDTDRLPEEKKRGITIELGFAYLALPGISLGIVDVPGHEDFVRNMIAGLGAIDLALLVVAADDGWMPQTEEHWQILSYLGVTRIVVALTKCDLGDVPRVREQINEKLGQHSLGELPIVPTSVRTGEGLEVLKQTLTDTCRGLPDPADLGKPRLFVDRVFSVHGTGTVVTGTLTGGRLAKGETVTVQPQNLTARIRAIQSHNQPREVALPGSRTALGLPELQPAQIPRGSVLTTLSGVESGRTIDVLVERSQRGSSPARSLKNASTIQMHYGSARFTARIAFLDRRELLLGDRCIARLHLPQPIFLFLGDRFILRDSSGRATIAGGIVLNPNAVRTRFRSTVERNFLAALAIAPNDLSAVLKTRLQRDHVTRRDSLLRSSHFSAESIEQTVAQLARESAIFLQGNIVADSTWWGELYQRAAEAIDAEHTAHSERSGLDLKAFRSHLALGDSELEDTLVADLCRNDFATRQGVIRRRQHRPALPPALSKAGANLRTALAARPFDPPSRKELASDLATRQALQFLHETGEVIFIKDDVVLSATAFTTMQERVAQTLRARGHATAGELRQALATSRRVIIPFLEQCDRLGLTIREGDARRLR